MSPSAVDPPPAATIPASSTPRILVPEKLSAEGLALLRATGYQVDNTLSPPLSAEDLLRVIPSYHALIVRSETKVTAAVLAAASNKLRVVARAGVGVDNIDVEAATRQGIVVVNSPSGNIVAAAEHTVALLLATARNVGRADKGMKEAKWERGKLVGVEVGRKTLGIVGFGKVGIKVARMAVGLGMRVVVFDPYASKSVAEREGVELMADLDALLPEVDFLTVHTPLLASTLNLLGEKELKSMKKTARVLNVARGGVYNEEALLKALDEGWIAGAGLDVFTSEPPAEGSVAAKLAAHPKVVSTPHLGASTVEAQENVSMDVCTQVVEILNGGLPTAAVNAPLILPEEYKRLQPFVRLYVSLSLSPPPLSPVSSSYLWLTLHTQQCRAHGQPLHATLCWRAARRHGRWAALRARLSRRAGRHQQHAPAVCGAGQGAGELHQRRRGTRRQHCQCHPHLQGEGHRH